MTSFSFARSGMWIKVAVVAVLAAAAAVVAILSMSSDDGESSRRAALRDYIASVNMAQQELVVELHHVNEVYGDLRLSGSVPPRQLQRVADAEATMRRLRARLADIPAPPDARRLRGEIVELADLYVAVAAEVASLTRYVAFQAGEAEALVDASSRFERELGAATTAREQRAAVDAYAARLAALGRRLENADAPALLEPSRRRQVARMRRLSALARQLGAALENREVDRANRIFGQFATLMATSETTKADQAAVRTYNARLAAINEQRASVVAERRRLSAGS